MNCLFNMDPFSVYKTYLGIKSHFNSATYDYTLYGNVNAKHQTFLSRRDRYFFEKISKKYKDDEIVNFFVANFLTNENIWVGDLLTSETESVYCDWRRRRESIEYIFEQDVERICENLENNNMKFDDMFKCQNGHPHIFKMLLQKQITPETYVILDNILNFIKNLDNKLNGDVAYSTMSKRYKKYKPFVIVNDIKWYVKILRDKIKMYSLA